VLTGAGSLDHLLVHMLLLGHDFELLGPVELAGRCRAMAERLLSAAATIPPVPDLAES
jgi:hypothetical protein